MKSTIFYSWQSDLPNSINKGFIQTALESVARRIRNDDSIEISPVIDRDTQNVPGAPDIAATIFEKIDNCDIFVCDVTIINADQNSRPTPNPNVLLELGYAVKHLGWNRIIMICNTAFGRVEKLPFDLRMKRVLAYELAMNDAEKPAKRKELEDKLRGALQTIFSHNKKAQIIDAILGTAENEISILNREDAILFQFACEVTLKDDDSMVSTEAFEEKAASLNLFEDDLIGTIEILEEHGLIQVSWTHGSRIPSFEVATKGFEVYGRRYIEDFADILMNTLVAIETNGFTTREEVAQLLQKPPMFAEYIIDILAKKNLVDTSNSLFNRVEIEQVTTKGKRLISQLQ